MLRTLAVILFGAISLSNSALASADGRFYFNNEIASTHNSNEGSSPYQIEYEIYDRDDLSNPWQKVGGGKLCYSSQIVEGCYRWVGGLLSIIELPSDPSGNPNCHSWTYGVGFSEPGDQYLTMVSTTQAHQRSKCNGEPWASAYPGVLAGKTGLRLGSWAEIEFAQAKDRFTKVKARLIPTN